MTQSAKNSNFQYTDKKHMEDLEKRKTIESFTLMDDIFMRLVFEEKSCTEYVLQVLMNKKSLKVKGNKNIKVIVDKPIDPANLPIQEQKNIHKIVNDIIRENLKKYKI